jgi:hypothetical protein
MRALACPALIRLPKENETKLGVSRKCGMYGENYQLSGNIRGKDLANSITLN